MAFLLTDTFADVWPIIRERMDLTTCQSIANYWQPYTTGANKKMTFAEAIDLIPTLDPETLQEAKNFWSGWVITALADVLSVEVRMAFMNYLTEPVRIYMIWRTNLYLTTEEREYLKSKWEPELPRIREKLRNGEITPDWDT